MVKSIRTSIDILARPEIIWSMLIDFEKYQRWNPYIVKIEGANHMGSIIRLSILPPFGKGVIYNAQIVTLVENKELSWCSIKAYFYQKTTKHKFFLIKKKNGMTTLIHELKVQSFLALFYNFSNTLEGFRAMNSVIKERAENLETTLIINKKNGTT